MQILYPDGSPRRARARAIGLLVAVAVLAAGCAGLSPADEKSGEIYYRHAGEPVEEVHFANLLEWRPVGSEAVLLRFDGGRYYLFEVTDNCAIDLRWSNRLSVANLTPTRINTFDRIRLDGQSCRITGIRPVDFQAVRAELDARGKSLPAGQLPAEPAQDSGGT